MYRRCIFNASSLVRPDLRFLMDRPRVRELLGLAVDIIMLVLIVANLTLIIIDWGFESVIVQRQLQTYLPSVHRWYDETIHQHFLFYDLAFVAIFVTEILIRWGLAIYRQRYHRWFFYPFVHWYDVLGCIPVSSLRSLRLFRVIAMIPKMQRLGLFDLKKTYVYEKFEKYRAILLEEISDRVTVRIIEGLQKEIRGSHPVTDRIAKEVIEPQREALIQALTHRLQEATAVAYSSRQDDFHDYLDDVIAEAVNRNREINTIASLPGVGTPMATLLENAISDIVFNVIDRMVEDVASLENDRVIAEVTAISTDTLLSPKYDQRLNRLARSVVLQSLDVIKEHVEIKTWKQTYSDPSSPQPAPAAS
ncbi:hypothetical protein BSZ35_03495 [Salinibacter sp. 10B]|nr:hypothetical protein BSZ35_03495 [Salinibacter sp. 10B]